MLSPLPLLVITCLQVFLEDPELPGRYKLVAEKPSRPQGEHCAGGGGSTTQPVAAMAVGKAAAAVVGLERVGVAAQPPHLALPPSLPQPQCPAALPQ